MNIDEKTRRTYFEKLRSTIDNIKECRRMIYEIYDPQKENDKMFELERLLIWAEDNIVWVYEDLDIYR